MMVYILQVCSREFSKLVQSSVRSHFDRTHPDSTDEFLDVDRPFFGLVKRGGDQTPDDINCQARQRGTA